jgi:bifunctional non-homologous end joining protein LigD
MGLREYHRKRNFRKTPEPSGRAEGRPRGGDSFVIQKHDASRMHYDFRLEMDGTLKSWAVPKGPTLDPEEKRLAVHVEDHPLDYASFEGTIPEGEYGGGTVMVWDRGRWIPHGDPREMYRKGRLSFELEGQKLHGSFSLVRMGGEAGEEGKNWLLIKRRDEAAHPLTEGDVLKEKPDSVVTGRDLSRIARGKDAVWRSNRAPAGRPAKSNRARGASGKPVKAASIPGARPGRLPAEPRFELATLVSDAPEGDAWIHEIKFDGYRAFCRLKGGTARFLTRGGNDWTAMFGALASAAGKLPAREALLDGEVVALDGKGVSDFQRLQNSLKAGGGKGLTYMAFDLLHLDGTDLAAAPLAARKEALERLLGSSGEGVIRYSAHVTGDGPEFSRQACRMALEGIISKRKDRPYRPGRGRDWLKVKCLQRQEFVIGGLTRPAGSRTGFGALLMGYFDDKGHLRYAGKVGTGFTEASLRDLTRRLEKILVDDGPFHDPPPRPIARQARWVRPEVVAEVEFTEWTRDGRMRHPTFRGVREDRKPREVTRERATPVEAVASGSSGRGGGSPTRVGGARITHPGKVLYPEQGITKGQIAEHYALAGERMLPYVGHRPLMLVRCPEGHHKECFFQKHAGQSLPEGVRRVPIQENEKIGQHMMVDSVEGIIGLLQMGALEIHMWGTKAEAVEKPDLMVLDLDPDTELPWEEVVRTAFEVRERLAGLGLRSFVKTTGGKGLHVVSPLVPGVTWDELKEFSHGIARAMVADAPDRFTSVMSKSRRKGKIYVDYLRNGRGATFIAPYSTRSRSGAPVSAPLSWKELTTDVRSDGFTLELMAGRLRAMRRDPWSGFEAARRPITAKMRRAVPGPKG